MQNFHYSYFFDLINFKHQDIFIKTTYVWEALDNIKSYLQNQKLGTIEIEIPSNCYLINRESITIGKGTIIEPGAYIKGPCIIGENCTIRHGAYIRGDVITGDNVTIGHDSEIKHSILLNNSKAAHFAYVGDSILGFDVNLGAGVKLANLRIDHNKIFIRYDSKEYPTNRKKMGAILGDKTQIGCNSVTNPGTLTGKEVFCYPCINFGGFIESDSLVKPEVKFKVQKLK